MPTFDVRARRFAGALAVFVVCACGADPVSDPRDRIENGHPASAAGSGGTASAQDAGSGGSDFGNNSNGPPPELDEPPPMEDAPLDAGASEVCVQDNAEATLELRPIDIIFTIDTSLSMLQEIAGVQNNVNANFASIIGASGIDYRVILISSNDVCIGPPLNPMGCGQSSPPLFYYVNSNVGSHDTWCVLLDTYPMWSGYLRPEAFKVFVAVTDDSPDCGGGLLGGGQNMGPDQAGADTFDAALLALDPAQFGTATERNYVFHSLVALAENTPATAAYEPTDPIVTGECSTAAGNGEGYQHLSQKTGGLRFPVCEGNNFDAVFQRIAQGIVEGAAVACEFEIPAMSEDGKAIDRDTIEVAYVPGDQSATIKLDRAADVGSCAMRAFYVDGDLVKVCPEACDSIKTDPDAQVQVLFGCDVCGGLDVDCGTEPPPELPPVQ